MKKSVLFLLLTFSLIFAYSAEASLYLSANGKTFNINVTRNDFRPIYDARGNVFVSGNSARIEVRAQGYRTANRTIYLNPNNNYYNETISLDDPTVFADLLDSDHGYIANGNLSYYSQSFYQTDEYGIKGRFPVAGFEKLTSRDFDVRVNSMFAWLPRVYLNERNGYWDFEVVIKRRDFSDFSNRIQIFVNKTPAEIPAPVELVSLQIQDYLNISKEAGRISNNAAKLETLSNRLSSLARDITGAFPALDAGERTSIIQQLEDAPQLKRELNTIQQFEVNHRN